MRQPGTRRITRPMRWQDEKALGEIRKVVVHAGHRGPKEIGVQPEFLAWLTDPDKNGAGPSSISVATGPT